MEPLEIEIYSTSTPTSTSAVGAVEVDRSRPVRNNNSQRGRTGNSNHHDPVVRDDVYLCADDKALTTFDFLLQNRWTASFLYLTFLKRPNLDRSTHSLFWTSVYALCVLLVAVGLVEGFYLVIAGGVFLSSIPVHRLFFQSQAVLTYMSMFSLLAASVYSWIHTHYRLHEPMEAVDVPYIERAVSHGLLFGSVFSAIAFIGEMICVYSTDPGIAFGVLLFIYFYCCGISLSMFCVYIDARTAAAMVDDLSCLADMENLTVSRLRETRDKIDAIAKKSNMPNAVLALAAIINGVTFVLVVLMLRILTTEPINTPSFEVQQAQFKQLSFIMGVTLTNIAYLLKEVIFLFYILFEISRVNDKADELYAKLANNVWTDAVKDNERIKCYVSYSGTAISYTILTFRPTRLMIYSTAAGYIISLALALVQEVVNPILNSSGVA